MNVTNKYLDRYISLSNKLKDYQETNRLSNKALAKMLDFNESKISKLLKNNESSETITKPTVDDLIKIHEVTGLSVDYLLGLNADECKKENDKVTYKMLLEMLEALSNKSLLQENRKGINYLTCDISSENKDHNTVLNICINDDLLIRAVDSLEKINELKSVTSKYNVDVLKKDLFNKLNIEIDMKKVTVGNIVTDNEGKLIDDGLSLDYIIEEYNSNDFKDDGLPF